VGEDYNERRHEIRERVYIVLGDELGYLKLWDLTAYLETSGVDKVPRHIDVKTAFNPRRQEKVDCSGVTAGHRTSARLRPPQLPPLIDPGMTGVLVREAQAHTDVIKNIARMKLDDSDTIVTGAKDNRVRIWTLGFDLLGNLNGKTDLDDPKWAVPTNQRVINREKELKQVENLMDNIDMGLNY